MPSSRLNPRFTMLAAICTLAAISAPTVHSAYLPLDIEDHAGSSASAIASNIPVSASKANHLASGVRNGSGPLPSAHREPEQATHREQHATTHAQSALHPAVTGAQESEQATHREHHTHTTTHAQSASHPAVTSAPISSHLPVPVPMLLRLPQHLLEDQPTTGHQAEDSDGTLIGSSVTPRTFGETLALDVLNPLLLFEEIEDALSRADPQSQGLAQRGPGERVPQAVFAPHTGLDTHGERGYTQGPVVFSGEHSDGGEGVVSGMRKREDEAEGEAEDGSGVPGTIDIMSTTTNSNNSTGLQHIGSLVLARADMPAAPADPAFFLNASSTHQTRIYLLPIHPAGPKSTSSGDPGSHDEHTVAVALQLPMFDPASAAVVRYCATFHPRAAQPEPLAVERCLPEYRSRAEGKSQAFAYDSPTGVVRPMWLEGDGDDGDDGEPYHRDADADYADAASDALDGATGAGMFARNMGFGSEGGSVNSTAAAAAAAPPASHAANSPAPMSGARDVTLVFTPVAPEASAQTDVIAAAAASDDGDERLALALASPSTSATSASYSGSTSSQSGVAQPSPAVDEAVWATTAASSASSASSGTGSSFLSSGSSMATEANLVNTYATSMGDMQSDSTGTATLPPGSAASYTASTGVSPANAEASPSPTTSAGSGNSLGPMQSSSAAPPMATASDAGDANANANIAAGGPPSSSLSVSSSSTSSAGSGTWAASSSTPVPMAVAGAAQTAASTSSSSPVEAAGATASPTRTPTTTSVSESPVFTNINAEGPVSSLASSSAAMPTPSSASTSTASTAAPAASPSAISAEAIASLIADTAFSVSAAPPAASSPATEAAIAVEDYSPALVAVAEAGSGSAAAGAPTPLVEEVGVAPEEWVFAPEARL